MSHYVEKWGVGREGWNRLMCKCLMLVMVMISPEFTCVKSIIYLKYGHLV